MRVLRFFFAFNRFLLTDMGVLSTGDLQLKLFAAIHAGFKLL